MEFLDTYALVMYVEGSLEAGEEFVTLDMNLAELYYVILRRFNEKTADHFHRIFSAVAVPMPRELIPAAMKLRLEQKGKRFSYADCLGYTYAQVKALPFVTGDVAFKGMRGVKMVRQQR